MVFPALYALERAPDRAIRQRAASRCRRVSVNFYVSTIARGLTPIG